MDALVESSQGDMRVIIGQLQMHRVRAKALSYDDVKSSATKDMDKSPFECARQLLSVESASWSMSDRMDAVFQDMDLVPLLVQVGPCLSAPFLAMRLQYRSGSSCLCIHVVVSHIHCLQPQDVALRCHARMRRGYQWFLPGRGAVPPRGCGREG